MCAYGTTNDEDAPYSHFPLVLFSLWASDTKKCPGLLKKILFFPLRPPSFTYLYSILWIHVFFIFYFNWKTPSGYNWRSRIFPHSTAHFVYLSIFCAIFFLYILPCLPTFIPCYVLLFLFFLLFAIHSTQLLPSTMSLIPGVSSSNTKKNSFFFCVWMCCLPCLKIGGKDVYISL